MTRRRWPGRDRGAFTAELAAGLPALMVLLIAGITAVNAVTSKAQCVDAAREGALAAARGAAGESVAARVAPDGAKIDIALSDDTVRVAVEVPIRVFGAALPQVTARGVAVAAREPDSTAMPGTS